MFGKAFTIGVMSACLAGTVLAQNPPGPVEQPGQLAQKGKLQKAQLKGQNKQGKDRIRKFQRTLNLSTAQTEQLKALMMERYQKLTALRSGNGKRKGEAKTIQEQFRTNLRAILTPDQTQIFDQKLTGKGRKV